MLYYLLLIPAVLSTAWILSLYTHLTLPTILLV